MSIEWQGPVSITFVTTSKRVPADDHVDKLRERKREIGRKLGDEAAALRVELKAIDAAISAYEKAQPKKSRKIGVAR